MPKRPVIAIDGPAASGKTTLAQALADRLALVYYDTGALYRAVTLAALERGIDPSDGPAVAALARTLRITIAPPDVADGRPYTVRLDGRDVTWALRSPDVDAHVSVVSAHPSVRRALLATQRKAARRGGVVMVGRDVGTVVAPEATLKIYLTASPAVRAERRWRQLRAQGEDVDLGEVLSELLRRDDLDAGRAVAPLRLADDAVPLDTDALTVEEMVERAVDLVRTRLAGENGATRVLRLPRGTVHLRAEEYALLAALVRAPGQVCSYADLAEELWGPGSRPPSAVRAVARSLRRKLARDGPGSPRLETVRGQGYRLLLPPRAAQE